MGEIVRSKSLDQFSILRARAGSSGLVEGSQRLVVQVGLNIEFTSSKDRFLKWRQLEAVPKVQRRAEFFGAPQRRDQWPTPACCMSPSSPVGLRKQDADGHTMAAQHSIQHALAQAERRIVVVRRKQQNLHQSQVQAAQTPNSNLA